MTSCETDWTFTLIHELVCHGVDYFCLAPGSRSTPLVLAIHTHPKATCMVHFDERAMAFYALGYAKASKKPVAIVVTSGTAAGNLLPAIMEAHENCIPLFILTADRPLELQDCGANQTTHQLHMFNNYVRFQHAFPTPDACHGANYLKSTIAHATVKAMQSHPGPVHLNCPFREPFSLEIKKSSTLSLTPTTTLVQGRDSLQESQVELLCKLLSSPCKGLILLGEEALTPSDTTPFYALAEKLQWPILCDPLSYGRDNSHSIQHYDLMWDALQDPSFSPTCILHFGKKLVSKSLRTFLQAAEPSTYIHVFPYEKRIDPAHLVTHRVFAHTRTFCEQITPYLPSSREQNYLQAWLSLNTIMHSCIEELLTQSTLLTEGWLFHHLSAYDFSHISLFVGSGMPIRSLMHYFHPKKPPRHIYGNRGLSGIDGNIATSCGLAAASQNPMIIFVGDQACLHDATSLSLIKQLTTPLLLVIINNQGGNIFSLLPIYKHKEVCEKYFINSHNLSFEALASWFEIPYVMHTSIPTIEETFQRFLDHPEPLIVEIKTSREEEHLLRNHLKERFSHSATYAHTR